MLASVSHCDTPISGLSLRGDTRECYAPSTGKVPRPLILTHSIIVINFVLLHVFKEVILLFPLYCEVTLSCFVWGWGWGAGLGCTKLGVHVTSVPRHFGIFY